MSVVVIPRPRRDVEVYSLSHHGAEVEIPVRLVRAGKATCSCGAELHIEWRPPRNTTDGPQTCT